MQKHIQINEIACQATESRHRRFVEFSDPLMHLIWLTHHVAYRREQSLTSIVATYGVALRSTIAPEAMELIWRVHIEDWNFISFV